jgi:hypothetical protein
MQERGLKLELENMEQCAKLAKKLPVEEQDMISNSEYQIQRLLAGNRKILAISSITRASIKRKQEMITQHRELRQQTLKSLQMGYESAGDEVSAKGAETIAQKEKIREDWKKTKNTM